MDVSDVLRDRMREPGGFEGTAATMSLAAHGVFVTILLFAPHMWVNSFDAVPPTVMTIRLGGAPGPPSGGLTAQGAKPIQEVKTPEEAAKPEALRPPAAKTPEMTLPEKNGKPEKTARAQVKEAPTDAHGRTPTRGTETRAGTAAADLPVRGQGFGLSTGGGALGDGSYLDVSDFCCPEYLMTMKQLITRNWHQPGGAAGIVIVKFTVQRDGTINDQATEQSSGNQLLDLSAQRAIYVTRRLPPLPAAFPNPTLGVHLAFKPQ